MITLLKTTIKAEMSPEEAEALKELLNVTGRGESIDGIEEKHWKYLIEIREAFNKLEW